MVNQKRNPEPDWLVADGSGFETTDQHEKRIGKISSAKRDQINIVAGISKIARISTNPTDGTIEGDPFWINTLKPIHTCANYLAFRHYFEFEHGEKKYQGEPKLFQVFTCKRHLVCPVCAIFRSLRQHKRHFPKLEQIIKETGLTPYHLTLTVPNTENLMEAFNNLVNAFRELLKIRRYELTKDRYKQHTELSKAEGVLYSVEIKRGKAGKWHPHIHMILLCREKPYVINKEELFASRYMADPDQLPAGSLNAEWYKLTDGFMMRLDEIKSDSDNDKENLFGLLAEVLKYGCKSGELGPRDTMTVYENLRGKRLIGSVGVLRGLKMVEAGPDDDHPEDMLFDEYFYRFLRSGSYELEEIKEHGQIGN